MSPQVEREVAEKQKEEETRDMMKREMQKKEQGRRDRKRCAPGFHPVSWQIKTKLPSEHTGRSAGTLITSTCPSLIQPTTIHQHFKTSCLVNSELDVFLGVSQLTKKRSARDCVVINLANVSNGMVMWL